MPLLNDTGTRGQNEKKNAFILQMNRAEPLIETATKVRKRAKIRNRYNQVPHLTQDTNVKATNSQLDITNESQEVSPFPAGDHKAPTNRRA